MKTKWSIGAVVATAALAWVAPLFAGPGVGDDAPGFEGSEFINTPAVSMKDLRGQVVLYEIFRTW